MPRELRRESAVAIGVLRRSVFLVYLTRTFPAYQYIPSLTLEFVGQSTSPSVRRVSRRASLIRSWFSIDMKMKDPKNFLRAVWRCPSPVRLYAPSATLLCTTTLVETRLRSSVVCHCHIRDQYITSPPSRLKIAFHSLHLSSSSFRSLLSCTYIIAILNEGAIPDF